MKLLIAALKAFQGYVSRQRHVIFRELIDRYGWSQMEWSAVRDSRLTFRELVFRHFHQLPRVILFWEGYAVLSARRREIETLPCRKCIMAEDLHWHDADGRTQMELAFRVGDTILSAYWSAMESLHPEIWRSGKVVWAPHGASPDFAQDFNPAAENAVLLSGAMSYHYPLRHQMKRLSGQERYAINHVPHPGYEHCYDYQRDDRVGVGFANLIRRHRAAFTDSSIYRYVLAKYFEIPATGALLLADRSVSEELGSLGFVENRHYVGVDERDLASQLDSVLDPRHHHALDEMRKRAQALVWERHKTSDRARLIDGVCA